MRSRAFAIVLECEVSCLVAGTPEESPAEAFSSLARVDPQDPVEDQAGFVLYRMAVIG